MAGPSFRPIGRNSKSFLGSEWKVFVLCFIVACILWALTSMNETYSDKISLRVQYYNLPENRVFVRPLPEEIQASVVGKGWSLLGYSFKDISQVIYIDLNDFEHQNFILSRQLKMSMQQQLTQKIAINDIYPDTISLLTAKKMTKTVPVRLNVKLGYAKQYNLGGDITYSPDSVTISGPATLIKKTDTVETVELTLKGLDAETSAEVELKQPPQANISYSVNSVKVHLPVYQLTEQLVEIPIEVVDPKVRHGLKLIPEKVTLTYQTTLNNYGKISPDMFQAVVDGSLIDTTRKDPLKVQIIAQPKFTYNLRMKQDYVNYIIER